MTRCARGVTARGAALLVVAARACSALPWPCPSSTASWRCPSPTRHPLVAARAGRRARSRRDLGHPRRSRLDVPAPGDPLRRPGACEHADRGRCRPRAARCPQPPASHPGQPAGQHRGQPECRRRHRRRRPALDARLRPRRPRAVRPPPRPTGCPATGEDRCWCELVAADRRGLAAGLFQLPTTWTPGGPGGAWPTGPTTVIPALGRRFVDTGAVGITPDPAGVGRPGRLRARLRRPRPTWSCPGRRGWTPRRWPRSTRSGATYVDRMVSYGYDGVVVPGFLEYVTFAGARGRGPGVPARQPVPRARAGPCASRSGRCGPTPTPWAWTS